jgi:hypothetical protein
MPFCKVGFGFREKLVLGLSHENNSLLKVRFLGGIILKRVKQHGLRLHSVYRGFLGEGRYLT